jgi:hypothetical protein
MYIHLHLQLSWTTTIKQLVEKFEKQQKDKCSTIQTKSEMPTYSRASGSVQ